MIPFQYNLYYGFEKNLEISGKKFSKNCLRAACLMTLLWILPKTPGLNMNDKLAIK